MREILTTKYNPRAPQRPRLGFLGNSCTSAAAVAASTQPILIKPQIKTTGPLRGLGYLGAAAYGATEQAELSAIGVSGQGGASGAIGGAAKGASVGMTVYGPIGAAIGAVIGAIAGGLIHTSKFADWLAADTQIIQQMENLPAGFMGRALSKGVLEEMWTAVVVTGAMYAYNPDSAHSPSDMQNEFDWVMGFIGDILQCMNKYPIGAPINVTENVGNGVTFTLAFTNPGSQSSDVVAQKVMIPAYLAWCTHNGAVDTQPTHCSGDASRPINQLLLTLMTDYQIAQYPPPASQAPAVAAASAPKPMSTILPVKTATVTVTTPATKTAPAATTVLSKGTAVTKVTSPTVAAASAYVLPAGYGYNYAGAIVPVPTGYTRGPNGYILDSSGYIFGSANDDTVTDESAATPSYDSGDESYAAPTATPTATPVIAASDDSTYLYLGLAAVALYVVMKK
jgi:hypothetical protein